MSNAATDAIEQGCVTALKKASTEIARLTARNELLEAALEEIAKGEGAYNEDRHIHAWNTISNMKDVAQKAIAAVQKGQ